MTFFFTPWRIILYQTNGQVLTIKLPLFSIESKKPSKQFSKGWQLMIRNKRRCHYELLTFFFQIWSVACINQIECCHDGDEMATVTIDMLENVYYVSPFCPDFNQHQKSSNSTTFEIGPKEQHMSYCLCVVYDYIITTQDFEAIFGAVRIMKHSQFEKGQFNARRTVEFEFQWLPQFFLQLCSKLQRLIYPFQPLQLFLSVHFSTSFEHKIDVCIGLHLQCKSSRNRPVEFPIQSPQFRRAESNQRNQLFYLLHCLIPKPRIHTQTVRADHLFKRLFETKAMCLLMRIVQQRCMLGYKS